MRHPQRLLRHFRPRTTRAGVSLIETLIAIAVLGLVLVSVYQLIGQVTRLGSIAQRKAVAISLAEEQIEIVHNATYDNVGTSQTYPTGPLIASQTIIRDGVSYTVKTVVGQVDDPADYLICDGSPPSVTPCDTVVPDYKLVEAQVCWDTISCLAPVRLTTIVTPKTLENAANTGALFVTVLDADGQPVSGADVSVTNASPAVNVTNATDIEGRLQLLSLPPATDSYHITISKAGYTSDGTITPSAENPFPLKPHPSIVVGQVTSVTFYIDQVSTLTIKSLDSIACNVLGPIDIHLRGQRLIGQNPDVYLYDQDLTISSTGTLDISNLPWDDYTLTVNNSAIYDVAGINPPDTVIVSPNSNVTATISLTSHTSSTVRFIVRDAGSKLPLSAATVQLTDGAGYDSTLVTEQGTIRQTNWTGGAGQTSVGSADQYLSLSGGTSTVNANSISLATQTTDHSVSEYFSTTNLRDGGQTTADWQTSPAQVILPIDPIIPTQYAVSAQAQSIKLNAEAGRITRATLVPTGDVHGQTIAYELAADGVSFEAVTPGIEHVFATTGSDLRWRAVLTTTDAAITPVLTQVDVQYAVTAVPTTDGTLTSSTFDRGTGTNYSTLSWTASTPVGVGTDPVRFQLATNNDNTTWTYVGPDGTAGSYFTASGSTPPASLSNKQYLRYKVFLHTDSQLVVPSVSSISIIINNACTPPGQVFFSPLPADGTYTVTTTRAGYQDSTLSATISGNATIYIDLTPSP